MTTYLWYDEDKYQYLRARKSSRSLSLSRQCSLSQSALFCFSLSGCVFFRSWKEREEEENGVSSSSFHFLLPFRPRVQFCHSSFNFMGTCFCFGRWRFWNFLILSKNLINERRRRFDYPATSIKNTFEREAKDFPMSRSLHRTACQNFKK